MPSSQLHPIKQARQLNGLTQKEVAAACGVTKGAVSRWENGTDEPTARKAIKLTKLLPGLKFEQIYPPEGEQRAAA